MLIIINYYPAVVEILSSDFGVKRADPLGGLTRQVVEHDNLPGDSRPVGC
jgi:hypothetical protein